MNVELLMSFFIDVSFSVSERLFSAFESVILAEDVEVFFFSDLKSGLGSRDFFE